MVRLNHPSRTNRLLSAATETEGLAFDLVDRIHPSCGATLHGAVLSPEIVPLGTVQLRRHSAGSRTMDPNSEVDAPIQ
jgi:hypothetical protein